MDWSLAIGFFVGWTVCMVWYEFIHKRFLKALIPFNRKRWAKEFEAMNEKEQKELWEEFGLERPK